MQHASIHLRECLSSQSLLPSPSDDPISSSNLNFYDLHQDDITTLEQELSSESLQCKKDWFTYNGGDATNSVDRKTYKKPLFFDIALNYVELDMDRLQERAGRQVAHPPSIVASPVPQRVGGAGGAGEKGLEEKPVVVKSVVSRAKAEEIERPMTPEPTPVPAAKGGLSSLLGGWWGRK